MIPMFRACLLAAPFGALFLLGDASPAAAAHACYDTFIASDVKTGNNAPKARERARASWTEKARKLTGTPRISWAGATDHQWQCEQYESFGRVRCMGRARPCLG
jgi:hypothetical protein